MARLPRSSSLAAAALALLALSCCLSPAYAQPPTMDSTTLVSASLRLAGALERGLRAEVAGDAICLIQAQQVPTLTRC